MSSVEFYGYGRTAQNVQAGDLVLTHGDYFYSKLIQFGQALRFRGDDRKYAYWNHAALVLDEHGCLAEALGDGVVKTHIDYYHKGDYTLVRMNSTDVMRDSMQRFMLNTLRRRPRYGYVTILSIALQLLFASSFTFTRNGTAICSGFAARTLERNGEDFDDYGMEPQAMYPAHLARYFRVPQRLEVP